MKRVFGLILLVIQFNICHACDCNRIIGMDEAKNIFEGRVLSVTRIDTDYVRYEIVFDLKKKIKGEFNEKKMTVNVSCLSVACCGIDFKVGEKYIVYTFISEGKTYTSACTLTKRIES